MSALTPDPEEFVGEPPAGDASPDEFMSNDQSASSDEQPEPQPQTRTEDES